MLQRRYRSSQTQARKSDARVKIRLGDLVVKAGLADEDQNLILGALVDAARRAKVHAERLRLTEIGHAEFQNDSKKASTVDRPDGSHVRGNTGSQRK